MDIPYLKSVEQSILASIEVDLVSIHRIGAKWGRQGQVRK